MVINSACIKIGLGSPNRNSQCQSDCCYLNISLPMRRDGLGCLLQLQRPVHIPPFFPSIKMFQTDLGSRSLLSEILGLGPGYETETRKFWARSISRSVMEAFTF